MLPLLDPKTALLIKQYRYVTQQVTWEVAVGRRRLGESIEQAAQRQRAEEIGYQAGKPTSSARIIPASV